MNTTYKFEKINLPYGLNDLEPYFSEETINFHYGKHLQAYVDNLNKALENYPQLQSYSLEKLFYNIDTIPEEIRMAVKNNGGGVFNHNLFFSLLSPHSKEPQGALLKAIEDSFGSVDEMLVQVKAAAKGVFGSGWAWVASDKDGKLKIVKTANQDTIVPENLSPVLIVDVWEHAYYLDYQNRRPDYLDNWVNIINWEKAGELYDMHKNLDYSKM